MENQNMQQLSPHWKLLRELSVHESTCLLLGFSPDKVPEFIVYKTSDQSYSEDKTNLPDGYIPLKKTILESMISGAIDGYYGDFDGTFFREGGSETKCRVYKTSLQKWIQNCGLSGTYFSTQETIREGYLNKDHPCYSKKLHAVISAWIEVSGNPKYQNNKNSIKQNLISWLTEHAAEFDLIENGKILTTTIEDIAKVANWNEKGGAPKTPNSGKIPKF